MFRRLLVASPITALAIGGSTACATKKFVRTSVGEVNDKVDSLGRSVEETQERTRKNEAAISDVDKRAQAAAADAKAETRFFRFFQRDPIFRDEVIVTGSPVGLFRIRPGGCTS